MAGELTSDGKSKSFGNDEVGELRKKLEATEDALENMRLKLESAGGTHEGRGSFASSTHPASVTPADYEEADTCSVCSTELGKRKMNPRHHCRICCRSVCNTCSLSQVHIDGVKGLQRVCNPCVDGACSVKSLKEQLRAADVEVAQERRLRESAERQLPELERLRTEVSTLREEVQSAARTRSLTGNRAELEGLTSEHVKRVTELEARVKLEEKHKNDMANNLRSVEEKMRTEIATHVKRAAELQACVDVEEKHKKELAGNLRSAEQRLQTEIAAIESAKAQLEEKLTKQLQEEQRQRTELSDSLAKAEKRISLGEAQQLAVEINAEGGESARLLAEAKATELQEKLRMVEDKLQSGENARSTAESKADELKVRLQSVEDKLLDSQSVRDMFSKEKDTYFADLKAVRGEKVKMEEELAKTQERMRCAQAAQESARGKEKDMYNSDLKALREEKSRVEQELAKAQQKAREAQTVQPLADSSQQIQKDFESRMDRSKDEIEYLRKTCEEKESRIESLLAERDSFANARLEASTVSPVLGASESPTTEVNSDSEGENLSALPTQLQTKTPLQCPQGHALSAKICEGKALLAKRCSKCTSKLKKGSHRFSCVKCKHHVCEACVRTQNENTFEPPSRT